MPESLLILDSQPQHVKVISHHLNGEWALSDISQVDSHEQLTQSCTAHCVIIDHATLLGGFGGNVDRAMSWLRDWCTNKLAPPVVVLASPSNERLAVRYMKAGARDYLPKRGLEAHELVTAVRECIASVSTGSDSLDTTQKIDTEADTSGGSASSSLGRSASNSPSRSRSAARRLPTADGYRVIRPIGDGATAAVYLAHSEELGQNVALKFLLTTDANELQEALARFEQEYDLISKINSLAVVDIFDFGLAGELPYIALEYFPAGDLKSRMRNPVSEDSALEYLRQLARALEEIHRFGIVHRDLKPANVMLREDNTVALIDFGMAKMEQATTDLTVSGAIFGTPHYLSPEQAQAEPVDHRADLYACGILLFELLTGHPPYRAKNAVAVLQLHVEGPIPQLPDHLGRHQKVIDKTLAKSPADRYQSASELLAALS